MDFNLDFKVKEVLKHRPSQVMDWGVSAVHAPDIWSETKGEGVKIAILDTGVDYTHEDLVENIKDGINLTGGDARDYMDRQGHGSHVAGIIAASDNEVGVVGVAPKAELYIAKTLGDNGEGSIQAIIEGIAYAIHNKVDIISMSLGTASNPGRELHRAIQYAHSQGITIVAASGNESTQCGYPAAYPEVIAVGAVGQGLQVANFSNYGKELFVSAPGVDIYSTYMNNSYARLSGTSMATPIVSGVIALYIAYCRKHFLPVTPESIMQMIATRSDDLGAEGKDFYYGNGLIDAGKLVRV